MYDKISTTSFVPTQTNIYNIYSSQNKQHRIFIPKKKYYGVNLFIIDYINN